MFLLFLLFPGLLPIQTGQHQYWIFGGPGYTRWAIAGMHVTTPHGEVQGTTFSSWVYR